MLRKKLYDKEDEVDVKKSEIRTNIAVVICNTDIP
jgi:hypothetical protein